MSLVSAAAKRLRAALAAVTGPNLIGYSDATVYTAGTLGAKIKSILAGATFTGPVVLPGNAAADLQAVPRQQLNSAIAAALGEVLNGSTFTGPVVLPGDAVNDLEAVPLQQLSALLEAVVAGSYAEPPGDLKITLTSAQAPGSRRLLVQGQVIDLATYPTLAFLWCGGGYNAAADFLYRCTDPLNPTTTRADGGGYLVLPPPGYFLRVLNTGGAGVDVGRNPYALQDDDNKAHTHNVTGRQDEDVDTGGIAGGGAGATSNVATTSSGGTEARPKNWGVYVWLCY